jgi:hypothetical protein
MHDGPALLPGSRRSSGELVGAQRAHRFEGEAVGLALAIVTLPAVALGLAARV